MEVKHTFGPVYDAGSRILILGTIPSVRSREAGFYYMHPQNRFWRVLSDVLNEPFPESISDKKAMLIRRHIAIYDVLSACDINGSADSGIKNARPNDIAALISKTRISRVFVTGRTAERLYTALCEPSAGIPCEYLPSTSPANCAMKYDRLKEAYSVIADALNEK